jgi:hypothetical protein
MRASLIPIPSGLHIKAQNLSILLFRFFAILHKSDQFFDPISIPKLAHIDPMLGL